MGQDPHETEERKTSIAQMLSVRDGARAVAAGAEVVYPVDNQHGW